MSAAQTYYKDPPDGEWGWMVMVAATLQFFLNRGIQSAMSVLYIQFIDSFNAGAAATSWIPGTFAALQFCTGPIASFLSKKYDFRQVAMVGGIFLSVSFLVSSFANGVVFLYISLGALGGISCGLISTPVNVSLGRYFSRRYAFANSIAVTGNGVGSFVMPILCQFLINTYGWRGTLMIFASLLANSCVCASLLRPIALKSDLSNEDTLSKMIEPEEVRGDNLPDLKSQSVDNEHVRVVEHSDRSVESRSCVYNNDDNLADLKSQSVDNEHVLVVKQSGRSVENICAYSPLCFFLPVFKERPLFIIYVVYQFMYGFGVSIVLSHFVDNAVVKGISKEDAALLISLSGLTSCASCIVTGIVLLCINTKGCNKFIHTSAVAVFGLVALCTPSVNTFPLLLVIAIFLGLPRGIFSALDQVAIKEVVGPRRFTEGMGIAVFFIGSGFLVGPPTSGYIFDRSGSYDISFYCAGLVMFFGSSLVPIFWLLRRAKHKCIGVSTAERAID